MSSTDAMFGPFSGTVLNTSTSTIMWLTAAKAESTAISSSYISTKSTLINELAHDPVIVEQVHGMTDSMAMKNMVICLLTVMVVFPVAVFSGYVMTHSHVPSSTFRRHRDNINRHAQQVDQEQPKTLESPSMLVTAMPSTSTRYGPFRPLPLFLLSIINVTFGMAMVVMIAESILYWAMIISAKFQPKESIQTIYAGYVIRIFDLASSFFSAIYCGASAWLKREYMVPLPVTSTALIVSKQLAIAASIVSFSLFIGTMMRMVFHLLYAQSIAITLVGFNLLLISYTDIIICMHNINKLSSSSLGAAAGNIKLRHVGRAIISSMLMRIWFVYRPILTLVAAVLPNILVLNANGVPIGFPSCMSIILGFDFLFMYRGAGGRLVYRLLKEALKIAVSEQPPSTKTNGSLRSNTNQSSFGVAPHHNPATYTPGNGSVGSDAIQMHDMSGSIPVPAATPTDIIAPSTDAAAGSTKQNRCRSPSESESIFVIESPRKHKPISPQARTNADRLRRTVFAIADLGFNRDTATDFSELPPTSLPKPHESNGSSTKPNAKPNLTKSEIRELQAENHRIFYSLNDLVLDMSEDGSKFPEAGSSSKSKAKSWKSWLYQGFRKLGEDS